MHQIFKYDLLKPGCNKDKYEVTDAATNKHGITKDMIVNSPTKLKSFKLIWPELLVWI